MMKVRMKIAILWGLCSAASLGSINAAPLNLPVVQAARAVAPEIRTMILEEIFLGDRLGARSAFNPLRARLSKFLPFASPKYAVYANQTLKFKHDKLNSRHLHGKIVLFRLRNSWQIGVASKLALTNIKDEVKVNNFIIKTKDIEGVLVWDSPLYGKVAHSDSLSDASLMYVIDELAAQGELLGKESADGVYELKNFKLDTQALAEAKADEPIVSGHITSVFDGGASLVTDDEGAKHFVKPKTESAAIDLLRLPDGHFVSGQTLAVFTNGAKLVVGEHYRDVDRAEWIAAKEGELLRVYLIK